MHITLYYQKYINVTLDLIPEMVCTFKIDSYQLNFYNKAFQDYHQELICKNEDTTLFDFLERRQNQKQFFEQLELLKRGKENVTFRAKEQTDCQEWYLGIIRNEHGKPTEIQCYIKIVNEAVEDNYQEFKTHRKLHELEKDTPYAWVYNKKSRLMLWSNDLKALFGLPLNYQTNLYSFADFLTEKSTYNFLKAKINQLLNQAVEFDIDLNVTSLNGKKMLLRLSSLPNQEADGVFLNGKVSLINTKENKVTIENPYKTIVQALPDLIFQIDRSGNYINYFSSNSSLLWNTPDAFLGRNVIKLHGESLGHKITNHINKCLGTNQVITFPYKDINLPDRYYEARFFKADEDSAFVIVKNISEYKALMKKLYHHKEQFRLAVDSSNDGIWDWDVVNEQIFYSKRWKQQLGYEANELQNKVVTFEELLHPEDKEKTLSFIHDFSKSKELRYETEFRLRHKKGHYVWLYSRGLAVRNPSGEMIRLTGSHTDITERKALENALTIAKDKAQEANEAKSIFLANISHEIKTPLNSIIGFLDILLESDIPEKQKEYLHYAKKSGDMLTMLISDILDLSKIEAHKLQLAYQKVNLLDLLQESIDALKLQAEKKQLTLYWETALDLPRFIYTDPTRLKQILINLLSNAVKFTHQGSVTLAVNGLEAESNQEESLHFSVTDTGIGIPTEKQKSLFQEFSQVHTDSSYGGTGLGLSISNKILAKMGSQLKLESSPNKGSRFHFDLKLKKVDATNAIPNQALSSFKKIAVISDDKKQASRIELFLKHWKVESLILSPQEDLLPKIKKVDATIVNHTIWDNTKSILTTLAKHCPECPFIVLTNLSEKTHLRKWQQQIKHFHLCDKPFNPKSLHQKLMHIYQEKPEQNTSSSYSSQKQPLSYEVFHILIVDDVEMNLILVENVLQQMLPNALISTAENAQQSLEAFQQKHFDLILMDVLMPGESGFETTKKMRAIEQSMPQQHKTPIIALTAGSMHISKKSVLAQHMDDYLEKPLQREALQEVLSKYLKIKPLNPPQKDSKFYCHKEDLLQTLAHPEIRLLIISKGLDKMAESGLAIHQAHDRQDTTTIKAEMHKLKGIALNLKCTALKDFCAFHEKNDFSAENLKAFDTLLTKTVAALKKLP